MKQPYQLKTNYCDLNGYTDEAQLAKDRFLHDAKRLLMETGRYLSPRGLPDSQVSVNQAGIAVSGDVWSHYWNAHDPGFCGTCFITASAIGLRPDRVIITARKDEWREEKGRKKKTAWRAGRLGVNRDVPTDLEGHTLAEVLAQIFATGDFTAPRHSKEVLGPPFVAQLQSQTKAAPNRVQLSFFEKEHR